MHPTPIEWVRSPDGSRGFSSNPILGLCKIGCPYCYSKNNYRRFKRNPAIRFDITPLAKIHGRKKPAGIFLCSTHELFGNWIPEHWRYTIFRYIIQCPQHRFYVLTKRPGNILMEQMPPNVWLGTTITGEESEEEQVKRLESLMDVKAVIHFVSFEPLLGPIAQEVLEHIADGWVNWVIIGEQTQPRKKPLWSWVDDIIYARVESAGTSLFMKNNLTRLGKTLLTQEFPEENRC